MDPEELPSWAEGGEELPAWADGGEDVTDEVPEGAPVVGRVQHLPDIDIRGRADGGGTAEMTGEGYEEVLVGKPASGHEVEAGTQVGPDRRSFTERARDYLRGRDAQAFGDVSLTPGIATEEGQRVSFAGRDLPTTETLGNAIEAFRRTPYGQGDDLTPRVRADMGDVLNALVPTEDTDQPIVGPDMRDRAPAWGATELPRMLARLAGSEREAELRSTAQRAEEQAPGAYGTGASLPMVLGSAPMAPQTLLGRLGMAAGEGALAGLLHGGAQSDEDTYSLDYVGDIAADTAIGAGAGLATGGAIEGAGAGLRRAGQVLEGLIDPARAQWAADRMRSVGLNPAPSPRTSYGRSVQRMGGPEGVADALQAEAIGGRTLPNPGGVDDSLNRLREMAGGQFDEVMGTMDRAAREASGSPYRGGPGAGRVDVGRLQQALEARAGELAAEPIGSSRRAADRMRTEFIEPLEGLADEGLSFGDAHQMRQRLDEMSGAWRRASDPVDTSMAGLAQDARGSLSALMDEAAEAVDPAMREAWREGNRRWSLLRLVEDNARATSSNLPGALAEGIGLSQGNLGGAAMARAAGGLMSRYGPGLRAQGIRALIPMLQRGGPAMRQAAQALRGAATRGEVPLAAAHMALMRRRPDYRRAVQEMDAQSEEN